MNLFLLSLTLATSLSSLCVQPSLANWPVFYIDYGETAVVPCVPKGDETAYFWSKGEDYASSMQAASRVLNIPSSTWERYSVAENGSLVIENVNEGDGGIYHCRIVSEHTNCHGAISVKVLHQDFEFGIEECHPKETCTLQVEPDTTTNLSCTATGVPSSFSLKWYNGSEVITSVSSEHSSKNVSTTISETITMSSDFGLPLTCKAVDMENRQICGRFAHVRLNKTDKATQHTDAADKSSARWVIPLVLLIVVSGFTILLLIFIYVRIKKDKENTNSPSNNAEEAIGLMTENASREQNQKELTDLQADFEAKERSLQSQLDATNEILKANESSYQSQLNATIKDLKAKHSSVQSKLDATIEELKAKHSSVQSKLDATIEELKIKDKQVKSIKDELEEAKESLKGLSNIPLKPEAYAGDEKQTEGLTKITQIQEANSGEEGETKEPKDIPPKPEANAREVEEAKGLTKITQIQEANAGEEGDTKEPNDIPPKPEANAREVEEAKGLSNITQKQEANAGEEGETKEPNDIPPKPEANAGEEGETKA